MSNVLLLPQMTAIYHIALNADWVDKIAFTQAPPNDSLAIDITGIAFYAQLRPTETDPNVLIDMSTDNGLLVNNGANGVLSWRVRYTTLLSNERLKILQAGVLDVLAVADGNRINLFQEAGPAAVNIHPGVTLIP